jgi:long-chain acyl-CoA synthetase
MRVPRDVSQVLASALINRPDAEAVVVRSARATYAELDAMANQAARAWLALGVKSGDRVAVCLPNDLEIIVAFHAAMRVGAVWLGVGYALASPEKAYVLRDSGASVLLCEDETASDFEAYLGEIPQPLQIVSAGRPRTATGSTEWAQLVMAQSADPVDIPIDPFAPAAIAYTSGTTGFPKGALHSQHNLVLPGAYLVATRSWDHKLRKADCFALTLLNMLVLSTVLTAQAEGTTVMIDSLRAADIADWIRRERATVWNGPPPILYTMARDESITPEHLASLTEVWSGGADCPETIRSAFQSKFGAPVVTTYGLTEAPTMVAIEPVAAPHVSRSSGRALPHMEVTIRDRDGHVLPAGEIGEICVGPRDPNQIPARFRDDWHVLFASPDEPVPYSLMLGYWGQPEQTETALRFGVLHTGDAGSLDLDGNLVVTDRLGLLLNRGGANIYPAEIERVVIGWETVEACAVFGVPDERLGERVGMLVQFRPGVEGSIDDLLEHCRTQLAPYKVPELVAEVDEFPRNAMGKINRRALADFGLEKLQRVGAQRSAPE